MPAQLKADRSILIVEDDQVSRDALVNLLNQLGYQTETVATVAEGLASLNGQTYAILDPEPAGRVGHRDSGTDQGRRSHDAGGGDDGNH